MIMSEELGRLGALHERGVLSDEEFKRAKARVLGGAPEAAAPGLQAINSLRRSRDDRWLSTRTPRRACRIGDALFVEQVQGAPWRVRSSVNPTGGESCPMSTVL